MRVWRMIRYGAELLMLIDDVLDFLGDLTDDPRAQALWSKIKSVVDKIRG